MTIRPFTAQQGTPMFHSWGTDRGRPVARFRSITVGDGEAAVVFERGIASSVLDAGRHRILRPGTTVVTIDVRPRLMSLPLQEVPTADGITIRASVSILVQVVDPRAYVLAGPGVDGRAYLAAQVALRELVAAMSYEDLLAARRQLGERLLADMAPVGDLGLEAQRAEVRDLVLPAELRRAQAAVLVARAEGQAALERARGESAALRSLANAARAAADNPALLQLRLVQQLGASTGHTVVVGGPTITGP